MPNSRSYPTKCCASYSANGLLAHSSTNPLRSIILLRGGKKLRRKFHEMAIDLYYAPGSLPCRAVLLVAAKLNLRLNLKLVGIRNDEHLRADFLQMNPQHCVPLLVDDGFYLWESRAIMSYLADCYGKDETLYPKEPKARSLVDQRLYFDMGTLTKSFDEYYKPINFKGEIPDRAKFESVKRAFEILDGFLDGNSKYVAGPCMTIADVALVASTSNFDALHFELSEYENVSRWFNEVKESLPRYNEINEYGIKLMKERIEMVRNSTW